MQLPAPREFGWPLKPLSSARTSIVPLTTGQTEVLIDHDLIRGITTDMLFWWFSEFTRLNVIKNGKKYPAYHIWHPLDHVRVTAEKAEPSRPLQAGDRVRIEEMFQRVPANTVSETARISVLSTEAIGLEGRKLGHSVMNLVHRFENAKGGVRYRSRMVLGAEHGLLKPVINRIVVPRVFSEQKAESWLRHNVEEVGCFENFLADLYERRDQGHEITLP